MKHMGISLTEGDSIGNLAVPVGSKFPLVGSRGEMFCIANSATPNTVVDGLYVYLNNKWMRTSVIQDNPAATTYRNFATTIGSTAAIEISWSGFTANDATTVYTLGTGGKPLYTSLRGQYELWFSIKTSTDTNKWSKLEAWLTVAGVRVNASTSTEAISANAAPSTSIIGHAIVNITENSAISLFIQRTDGGTCTIDPNSSLTIRRLAPL